jgi:hypothetical protein
VAEWLTGESEMSFHGPANGHESNNPETEFNLKKERLLSNGHMMPI